MSGFFTIINNDVTCSSKYFKNILNDIPTPKFKTNGKNLFLGSDTSSTTEFVDENRAIYIMFIGEIYNVKDIYELINIQPQTTLDCEIIYHLYLRYGMEQLLQIINGAFSFVLHDGNIHNQDQSFTEKLYVARDPFGIKPLYQFEKPDKMFGFTTNEKYLEDLQMGPLVLLKPGTFSLFEVSFKALSAWTRTFKNILFYNQIVSTSSTLPDIEWIKLQLTKSIQTRYLYSQNIGCLLSGGWASSLLAVLIQEECKRITPDFVLSTFTVGVPGSKDIKTASKFAKKHGFHHTNVFIDVDAVLESTPPDLDDLFSTLLPLDMLSKYVLAEWIKKETKIEYLFTGNGAFILATDFIIPFENEMDKKVHICKTLSSVYENELKITQRCFSHVGLKLMFPFLDTKFVTSYMSMKHTSNTLQDAFTKI